MSKEIDYKELAKEALGLADEALDILANVYEYDHVDEFNTKYSILKSKLDGTKPADFEIEDGLHQLGYDLAVSDYEESASDGTKPTQIEDYDGDFAENQMRFEQCIDRNCDEICDLLNIDGANEQEVAEKMKNIKIGNQTAYEIYKDAYEEGWQNSEDMDDNEYETEEGEDD